MTDHYDTLGVARDASADDIKHAYRRLARKFHPDLNKEPEAEARFKEVGDAYATLSDDERRAHYDQTGENEAPNEDALARAMMLEILDRYVEADGAIARSRANLRNAIDNAAGEALRLRQRVRFLEKRLGKVICKSGHNHAEAMLQERIKQATAEAALYEKLGNRAKRALGLLSDYEDAPTQPEPSINRPRFFGGADFGDSVSVGAWAPSKFYR